MKAKLLFLLFVFMILSENKLFAQPVVTKVGEKNHSRPFFFKKIIGTDSDYIYILFSQHIGKYSLKDYSCIFYKQYDEGFPAGCGAVPLALLRDNKILLFRVNDMKTIYLTTFNASDGSLVNEKVIAKINTSKEDNLFIPNTFYMGRYFFEKDEGVTYILTNRDIMMDSYPLQVTIADDSTSLVVWGITASRNKDKHDAILHLHAFDMSFNTLYNDSVKLPDAKEVFTVGKVLYRGNGDFFLSYYITHLADIHQKDKMEIKQNSEVIQVLHRGKELREFITDTSKYFIDNNFFIDKDNNLILCNIYMTNGIKDKSKGPFTNNYGMTFQKINLNNSNVLLKQSELFDSTFISKFINLSKSKKEISPFQINYFLPDGKGGYYCTAEQEESGKDFGTISIHSAPVPTMKLGVSSTGPASFGNSVSFGQSMGGGFGPSEGTQYNSYYNIIILHLSNDGKLLNSYVVNKSQIIAGLRHFLHGYYFGLNNNSWYLLYNDHEKNVELHKKNISPFNYKIYNCNREHPPVSVMIQADSQGNLTYDALRICKSYALPLILPNKALNKSNGEIIFYTSNPKKTQFQLIDVKIK